MARLAPGLDPREALLPITRLPGTSIPSLIPLPNLQRLYFKILEPIDTVALGVDAKDGAAWQKLYDEIRADGERERYVMGGRRYRTCAGGSGLRRC
jgi:hypothetical protein